MSRTFLTLCKEVVSDLGVAGGTLQSVNGQLNPEQQRIVNWVARADLYIQNLWADWTFLWVNDTAVQVAAGSNILVPTLPSWALNIQSVDETSLMQNYGAVGSRQLYYMQWDAFRRLYMSKPMVANPNAPFFSMDPARNLYLSNTVTDATTYALEYWVTGKRMVNDQDTSPVPTNFDTIICDRAKIMYAGRENAPEIMSDAVATYTDTLDKMQAYCLPENTASRRSQNNASTIPPSFVE